MAFEKLKLIDQDAEKASYCGSEVGTVVEDARAWFGDDKSSGFVPFDFNE